MDGRTKGRDKAAFSNFYGVLWILPKGLFTWREGAPANRPGYSARRVDT